MNLLSHIPKRLPTGSYRAIVANVKVAVNPEDYLVITLCYLMLHKGKGVRYKFKESFVMSHNIARGVEFLGFLESSEVDYDTIDGLKGMVFDAVVEFEHLNGKRVPVLTQKKLVAQPFND